MRTFKVYFTNGDSYTTNANGTAAQFEAYLKQDGGRIVDEDHTGKETTRWIDRVEEIHENDYFILRGSRIIRGKYIKLFKLDESPDSLLRDEAVKLLIERRSLTFKQANDYLNSLEYVPTRGG